MSGFSNLRARCPSIFSSIAIELNVPRDEFSSVAIELTFVALRRGLKKPVQSSLISVTPGIGKDFLSPITSVNFCITGQCHGCVSSLRLAKGHVFVPNIVIDITFY